MSGTREKPEAYEDYLVRTGRPHAADEELRVMLEAYLAQTKALLLRLGELAKEAAARGSSPGIRHIAANALLAQGNLVAISAVVAHVVSELAVAYNDMPELEEVTAPAPVPSKQ